MIVRPSLSNLNILFVQQQQQQQQQQNDKENGYPSFSITTKPKRTVLILKELVFDSGDVTVYGGLI